MNADKLERLVDRATALLDRLEQVLPQPLSAPDWGAAIAWRYRNRRGRPLPGRR